MLPEISPLAFVAGLLMVYGALAITFTVVFKSRSAVPLSRRRPDAAPQTSAFARLTDQTVHAINNGVRGNRTGVLSREKLDAAGLKKQAGDYILMSGAATLVAGVLGFFTGGMFSALLLALLAPVALYTLLNFLVSRRRRKFDEQVPDTLQMFSGGLRAGHSLLRAIDAAAQENEAPMAEELSRVVNETRIGRDLGESLDEVARRTDNEDFGWIARSVEIHREVGGDLAEVLDHVGETIRDRNQIRGQVRALSAEGRISALVLMALPIVMFIGLTLIQSAVFKGVYEHFARLLHDRRCGAAPRCRRLLAQPAHQTEVLGKQGETHATHCLRRHPGGHRPAVRYDLASLHWRPCRLRNIQSNLGHHPSVRASTLTANEQLASLTRKAMPKGYDLWLDKQIAGAGRPKAWPLARVIMVKPLLALAGAVLGILVYAADPSARKFALFLGVTALCYFLPDILLRNYAEKRRASIKLELPNALDQMLISVQAGLGFETAMARAGESGKGPLADELDPHPAGHPGGPVPQGGLPGDGRAGRCAGPAILRQVSRPGRQLRHRNRKRP